MRAVRFWMAAHLTGAVAPKPRPATLDVSDDAELVILTPNGAAYLAEQREQLAPTCQALYPSCRVAGCQDDPEPSSQECYRHQLVDAF